MDTRTKGGNSMLRATSATGGLLPTLPRTSSVTTDQYTQDVPEAGVKQNGKLSLGEDTADTAASISCSTHFNPRCKRRGKCWTLPQKWVDAGADFLYRLRNCLVRGVATRSCPHRCAYARTFIESLSGQQRGLQHAAVCTCFGGKPGQKIVRENACRVW